MVTNTPKTFNRLDFYRVKRWGGIGGIMSGRGLNTDDLFEMDVERVLGDRIRSDTDVAEAMWSAVTNVEWRHVGGDTALYSARAAGDMIAAIRGTGNYLDFYCCGLPIDVVSSEFAEAMAAIGWTYDLEAPDWED